MMLHGGQVIVGNLGSWYVWLLVMWCSYYNILFYIGISFHNYVFDFSLFDLYHEVGLLYLCYKLEIHLTYYAPYIHRPY